MKVCSLTARTPILGVLTRRIEVTLGEPGEEPIETAIAADDQAGQTVIAPALSSVVGYLLRRAHNTFQAYWQARFGDADNLTPMQAGILVVLESQHGISPSALARLLKMEAPTLLQHIDRLVERDYVSRVRRSGDRRIFSLELTPEGREALRAVEAFLPVRDEDLLAGLTRAEIAELMQLLTRIVARDTPVARSRAAGRRGLL